MSQHEADLEFSLEKMAWKVIKMRMLEFVLIAFCISTFFTTRTNLNQTNKFVWVNLFFV